MPAIPPNMKDSIIAHPLSVPNPKMECAPSMLSKLHWLSKHSIVDAFLIVLFLGLLS